MSDYVDGVLAKFIRRHEGQYLDHSHAYGPQAPDLIEYYLTDLLGRPWQFRAGAAVGLWDDLAGTMKDFERVERGRGAQAPRGLRPGDVLVWGGGTGFGTVGIYVGPGNRVGSVQMFTQNPGPAKVIDIMADGYVHKLLGAWRLTDAGERKALLARMKAQFEKPGWPEGREWMTEQIERKCTNPAEPEKRWTVEGATPEAQALIEDVLTDEVMRGIEREAADEAGRRMLQGVPAPKVEGWGEIRTVVETTTPAEPEPGHWLKRLFLRR